MVVDKNAIIARNVATLLQRLLIIGIGESRPRNANFTIAIISSEYVKVIKSTVVIKKILLCIYKISAFNDF